MAKDYAKRVFTTTRKPKKKRLRIELFIIPVLVLVIIASGYWGFRHKLELTTVEDTWLPRAKSLLTNKSVASKTQNVDKPKKIIQSNQQPDVHFDFYNELPKMQVTASESEDSATPKMVAKIHDPEVSAKQSTNAYVLQLGLFNDAIGASQLRLSLLLSGFEAEVR